LGLGFVSLSISSFNFFNYLILWLGLLVGRDLFLELSDS